MHAAEAGRAHVRGVQRRERQARRDARREEGAGAHAAHAHAGRAAELAQQRRVEKGGVGNGDRGSRGREVQAVRGAPLHALAQRELLQRDRGPGSRRWRGGIGMVEMARRQTSCVEAGLGCLEALAPSLQIVHGLQVVVARARARQ